jgi:polysaccharide deacetylase family protein (PEP-CTERM system associated)
MRAKRNATARRRVIVARGRDDIVVVVTNFLTFDIEEWFRVNYRNCSIPVAARDMNLERLVNNFLDLCDEYCARCTFFVLATVAETCPSLVRSIHARGHEVASHGYSHRSLSAMTESEFQEDTLKARNILQAAIGCEVIGYRAPSFSVSRSNIDWYYRVLSAAGFRYSSSVFPGKTYLYGIPGFPDQPHRPVLHGYEVGLVEYPISRVNVLGSSIPFYMRLFPARLLTRMVRARNRRGESVMLYLHPREIDPDQPRLGMPRLQALIHYWGVGGCEARLRYLLAAKPPLSRVCDHLAVFASRPPLESEYVL